MRTWLHQFDLRLTTIIQQWPEQVRFLMLLVTFIGQPIFTLGTGLAILWLGWMKANLRLAIAGLSVFGIFILGSLTKIILQRDRPLTEYVANMRFDTFSFPSGHALGSTIAYGLLAYLLWHHLPQPWNIIVAIALVVLIVLIGISRVYLGAHFPSDVLAGWLFGLAGLLVVIFVVQPKL